jgi:hypothetical protein
MTRTLLRNILGITVIVGHVFVLGLLVWAFLKERFLPPEFTTTIALIIPMFAGYTTAIVRFIVQNAERAAGPPVRMSGVYVFISFFFPVLLIVCCSGLIMLKGNVKALTDFENFKTSLGIIETVFASYVGLVITPLFRDVPNNGGPESP